MKVSHNVYEGVRGGCKGRGGTEWNDAVGLTRSERGRVGGDGMEQGGMTVRALMRDGREGMRGGAVKAEGIHELGGTEAGEIGFAGQSSFIKNGTP